ncbi:hypothetical protein [Streptomyces sp. NPDC007914]|uniref:hypothetical protein n=1 Tax=unclassified Streptomyces TaxID=2593676 RepID=UPI0036E66623
MTAHDRSEFERSDVTSSQDDADDNGDLTTRRSKTHGWKPEIEARPKTFPIHQCIDS